MNPLSDKNLPTWKINDATKVNCFLECPRKYFYSYVLGWRPEVPSNHLVFGTSWHIAMEYLLLNGYGVESVMSAHKEFLTDYRKTFGPDTDDLYWPKTPNNALITLNAYAARFRDDLVNWKPLYTEIAGKINIDEDQVLHFRMDSIMEHRKKGTIVSWEQKTGSNTWNWELQWPLSMQNGAYTHVLYCLFPKELVEGVIFRGSFFKKAKTAWANLNVGKELGKLQPPYDFLEISAKKNPHQMQTWLFTTSQWLDEIEAQFGFLGDCREDDSVMFAFPMNPTSCTRWFGCEFLDYCQAWQNPLQRCHQPPIGYTESHWDPSTKPAKKTFEIEAV